MAEDETSEPPGLVRRCQECNENSWTVPYESPRGKPRLFCSEACRRRYRRKFTFQPEPDESRECAHCEGRFIPRARTGRPPLYCSATCKQAAHQQRKLEDYRSWSQTSAITARLSDLRDDIHTGRTRASMQELLDLEAGLKSLLTVVQYRIHAASLDEPPD
ncbi:hypothetical protein [Streptomyces sp. NPDC051909]|uniref:hypothetical protein n=1 Tax=Streptomyces sp. NPDC051909 TaxID=3154944 RepID=UPI0034159897